MLSETLQKMEKVLGKVVSKPIAEVLAELQAIATGDRNHPAPCLAMAMVAGFSRRDLEESKRYLAEAERVIRKGRIERNVEWEFSESLFRALKNELTLMQTKAAQDPRKKTPEAQREAMIKAAIESRKAMKQMQEILLRLKESVFAAIACAALGVFSQTNQPWTGDYQKAMATLSRLFKATGAGRDLAGFFLMYGYRKNRNYRQAIAIGQELQKRNPRSPLVKMALGSAYHFSHMDKEAEVSYAKAASLDPNNPFIQLGYAKVLARAGKLEAAKKGLEKAESLDAQRRLIPFIEEEKITIAMKEKYKI